MIKQYRNTQLEILRIISIIMIIAHHYILYGVQKNYNSSIANLIYNDGTLCNKLIAQFLLPGGVVGVAIFFMLSGYFGIQSEKINIIKICEPVLVYSIIGYLMYILLIFSGVLPKSDESLINISMFFPLVSEVYWFASVYIVIILMKATLNTYIKSISVVDLIIIIIGLTICYAILRGNFTKYLGIINGLRYYFAGVAIKLNENKINNNKYMWLTIGFIGWFSYFMIEVLNFQGRINTIMNLIAVCVMGFLSGIGFMCFFIYSKKNCNKFINEIASGTFGIYLIHEHPLLREFLWEKLLKVSVQWRSNFFWGEVIFSVFIVFVTGLFIDIIKRRIFDKNLYKIFYILRDIVKKIQKRGI